MHTEKDIYALHAKMLSCYGQPEKKPMKKFKITARNTTILETVIEASDKEEALIIAGGMDKMRWDESFDSDEQLWSMDEPVEVE